MDIGPWLRDLGLERYEQAFREREIDPEVLPELTDAAALDGFLAKVEDRFATHC